MFKKLLKSLLVFNENHKPAPNFILVYALIFLLWHHQLMTALFTTQGGFSARITAAANTFDHYQYMLVLLLSGLFYLLRLAYYYMQQLIHSMISQNNSDALKVGADQYVAKNEDVQRLMDMLADTKDQLALAKEREQKANAEKTTTITQLMKLQAELDELKADNAVMHQLNAELKAKLTQTRQAENFPSNAPEAGLG